MEDSDEFLGFDDQPGISGESSVQRNEEDFGEVEDEGDDEEETGNDDAATNKRAPIWKHFNEIVGADGNRYAKCKHSPCEA